MRNNIVLLTTVSALFLGGCSQLYEPKATHSKLEAGTTITSTASLRHVFIHRAKDTNIVCTQPPPDVAFDQGESGDVSISLISFGGGDEAAEQEDSAEVELTGRTPTVLMTRELFYRACEFSNNYQLTKGEALTLYNKTLDTVSQIWATEDGNTTVTIGDTVSTTTGTTVQDSSSGTVSATESDTTSNSTTDSVTSSTSSQ